MREVSVSESSLGFLKKPITLDHLWLALPIVIVVAMGFRHKLRVLDFWWHLKMGEIIVETKSIPRTDLFSFTTEGKTFVLQNWLTEAIYYLVYQLGGLELLIVANAFVLLGALLFMSDLRRSHSCCFRFSTGSWYDIVGINVPSLGYFLL